MHRRRSTVEGTAMDIDCDWEILDISGTSRPENIRSQTIFALL
jgi:hypothetical protein